MRILIVDDSRGMRMLVMRAFRQAGMVNNEFEEAESGLQALDAVEQRRPDFVILDINMPVMNGLEVAATLQQKKIPFGFITALDNFETIAASQRVAASFILHKPFTPDEVVRAMSGIVG